MLYHCHRCKTEVLVGNWGLDHDGQPICASIDAQSEGFVVASRFSRTGLMPATQAPFLAIVKIQNISKCGGQRHTWTYI